MNKRRKTSFKFIKKKKNLPAFTKTETVKDFLERGGTIKKIMNPQERKNSSKKAIGSKINSNG